MPFGNQAGLADIRFGAKASLYSDSDRQVTVQVRASVPSGDSSKGLGTNSASVEPTLLFHENVGNRAGVEAQLGIWHPLGGSSGVPIQSADKFSGNVFIYGIGQSFDVMNDGHTSLSPVVELVGWRVLTGFMTQCTLETCNFDAKGINIVNLKVGARVTMANKDSIYAGFGWGLTNITWYDKLFRLEYRHKL